MLQVGCFESSLSRYIEEEAEYRKAFVYAKETDAVSLLNTDGKRSAGAVKRFKKKQRVAEHNGTIIPIFLELQLKSD